MLNRFPKKGWILGLVLIAATPVWAQQGRGRGPAQRLTGSDDRGICLAAINSTPKQALISAEAAGIIYMREEEKLAHDVYAKLYSKWRLPDFGNIAQGEEQHFGVMKLLLDRYELQDPAAGRQSGKFQNEGIQELYDSLTAEGDKSSNAALNAGATIEDLDTRDLARAAEATDNNDLKLVYQNLRQASENHMRTFVRQLNAAGETYIPQHMDPAKFSEIPAITQQPVRENGMRGNRSGPRRGNNGVGPWMKPR
jgi:hypothetical protein